MKILLFFSITLLLLTFNSAAFAQCKLAGIINENKMKIPKPFKYDGFNLSNINFDSENHKIRSEFMAFKGQKYNLVICTSGFEEQVSITVLDKDHSNFKLTEKILGGKENSWSFEPQKAGSYTIVIDFPPSETGVEHKECIVMLIGFSEK
ncbi:MAG: hypothetical protein M3R27_05120 [Bacteroidota bacterium]|nr:hypothetical protein [Bacteroidota bacterium]